MKNRNNKGQWIKGVSGNPKGRPSSISKVKEMLEPHQDHLINKVIQMALDGDMAAIKLCIDRLCPPIKSESERVTIQDLATAKTLTDKARCIISAVGNAEVNPDIACKLLSALSSYARAIEVDEFEKRIRILEGSHNA